MRTRRQSYVFDAAAKNDVYDLRRTLGFGSSNKKRDGVLQFLVLL